MAKAKRIEEDLEELEEEIEAKPKKKRVVEEDDEPVVVKKKKVVVEEEDDEPVVVKKKKVVVEEEEDEPAPKKKAKKRPAKEAFDGPLPKEIKVLLRELGEEENAGEQKKIRAKLRAKGYFISANK